MNRESSESQRRRLPAESARPKPVGPGSGSSTNTAPIDPAAFDRLVDSALAARLRAHAPYSRFRVGAALLTDDVIFPGCNVENASYSLTLCAERVAAVAAVTAGRLTWQAIAIASAGGVTPCGACRQFLAEFVPDLLIVTVDVDTGRRSIYRLTELLPQAFGRGSLGPHPTPPPSRRSPETR